MGSSSSGYRAPVEAPNTLQSMQEVTIVEAISEGPIVGLYTGDEKSIALNKNPLKTPEGAFTYQNVSWDIRLGLPDQEPFADVAGTESETGVGVEVTKYFPRASGSGSGAVTRTITNPNVTHVRVTLGVQGLYKQILDDEDRSGDTEGETVSYRVTVKDKDGNVVVRDDQSRTDKTMSQAQWAIKYALSGGAPWTVTVTKLHDDNEKSNIKNDLYWSSYTEIINRKMIYPHTALMMVRGNAETFGSSIPSRAYRVKGLIVEVPGNYDPATRTYSGIWDGTFQNAWTDNPAWILRDLIESDRYGLKKFFPPRWINPLMDKWTLYEIAKICDESVDDGFGGTEPRYTFNGQIMGAGEARDVVQSIASVFHGMTYWGSALMYATCDYPTDPLRTLNQSTINDGTLSYSTGSAREIHSVALVTWYDPDNYGEATIETVVDWDKYQRYGKSEVKVTAYGCYSRGQAYRHGLWTLLTEDEQWQCTLEQGLEGYDLMPGTVIKIADPNIMGIRYSGRAVNIGVDSVTLDAPVSLTVGETYTLYIVADDGTEESREITSRGTSNVVNVSAPFSKTFSDNPAWSISGTDAAPREFAVRSLKEKQDGRVEVSLREVNSAKYVQLESGIVLKRPPVRIKSPHGYIAAPTGLEVYANTYFDNGTPRQRLTFSWSASGDSDAALYEACYKTPSGSWNNFAAQRTSSVDIPAAVPGEWLFRVRACSLDGRYSEWAEKSYTLGGIALIPKAPVNLRATGGFRCATVAWDMPDDPLIGYFEVLMASSEDVADAAVVGKIYGASFDVYGLGVLDTRWFWARSVSYADNGIYSDTVGPVSATTNALQSSDLPDGTIQESHLAAALQTEIAKIPDIEVDISEIVDDVAAREAQIRSDVETIKEGLQDDIALVDQKIESTAQDLSDLSDATDTAVSRLSGDISAAAQQAAANVEAAKTLLRGEAKNLTDEMMEQLDALSEAVIGTLGMVKDVGDRLSDAGVYVDPDNGEVRIYGLDVLRRETDLRISNAEIMLDAQAAKISQKVTLAQVDERIAGMAFGDVGELLLEGVNARIDDVSQELDAQKVELRSKASSVTVQEHTARIAQAEADLQGLDAAIALKASLVELDLAVARIEAAELKIDAQNGTISGFVGQYADDFDALAEGVIQNASNQFESDKANRQAIAYAKQELIGRLNIVDGQLEAEAASRLILEAQIKNAAASLISEKELRAREDEAIATLVERVIVDVDSNRAAIIEEAELRADKDEAYGKMHNAMIASVDDSAGDADLAALISGFRGEQSIRRQMAGFYSDLDTRVKENEIAEATKREALVAQMNENKALIETEQLVRAAENEALALRIDDVFVEVGDAKAAITEEAQARADQYGALATQISGISAGSSIDKQELLDAIAAESQARIDAIEAEAAARGTALTAEEQARIAAIQAEATARQQAINSEATARIAAVREERDARVSGDSALSGRINALVSDVGGAMSAITEEAQTRADKDEAYGRLGTAMIAASDEDAGEAALYAAMLAHDIGRKLTEQFAVYYNTLDTRIKQGELSEAQARELMAAKLAAAQAAIETEKIVRADKDGALARRVSTIETKSGDNESAIQTLSEVTAGKPDIYNLSVPPVGTSGNPLKLGDLWINSNNEISRWNGAAWVKCSDKDLTDFKAQAAAATWIKTQVSSGGRRVVSGLGLLATAGNGSEFVILADRFYLVKDKNGELVQPFAVDASDPNDPKVVIEGNLFVQALKKGGYADATGWIIGDKIAAHSKIQLGAGGEFIAGGGAKFQMGNGAVFIDSETAQMMLRDPANLTTGDYIRIISGDISTYKYIAGAYREMKSLRKMSFGSNVENGATVTLDGYWPSAPNIIVSPCALQTFSPSYGTQAQTLLTQATNMVYNKATGRVTFKPVAKLVIDAGRQSIGGESSPATDTVFGQVTAGYRDSGSGQMVYPEVTLQSAAVTIPANATTATIRLNVFANCIASTDVMTGGSGGEGGPGSEYSYSRIESFWCRARTAYVIDGVEYDGWNKDFAAADEEHSYKHNYVAQWLEPSAKTFTLSAGSTEHTIAVKVYVSQNPVTGNNSEQRLTWQEYTPPALINRSFAALRMESVTYNLAAAQPLAQGTLNYMAIAE